VRPEVFPVGLRQRRSDERRQLAGEPRLGRVRADGDGLARWRKGCRAEEMSLVPLREPAKIVERARAHLVGDHACAGLECGPVLRRVPKAGPFVAFMPLPAQAVREVPVAVHTNSAAHGEVGAL
jgi:hypothetical protein